VAFNGSQCVAVGEGTNSIAYSNSGTGWTGLGTSILPVGSGVAWNGIRWVAVCPTGATGSVKIAYSTQGSTGWYGVTGWYGGTGNTGFTGPSYIIFTSGGYGVASNPKIGATIVPSQLVINQNSINQTNTLDLVSGSYCNPGPQHLYVTINSTTT
jgi:hypothetical protein